MTHDEHIETMRDNYDDHGAELAAKDAEIERLRDHIKFLNSFRPDAELARLREVMRRVANELGRENEGLVQMIRDALGE